MAKKFGIIALVGAPNAGKSTLVNALLGQKISITSPKVQTTRNIIKAILIENESQLVLLDTPGVFIPRSDKALERFIVKTAWQGIRGAEAVCFLIDVDRGLDDENKRIINELKGNNFTPIIALNKIDLVKKAKMLEMIKQLNEMGVGEIFMISATTKEGLDNLKQVLFAKCREGDWQYNEEDITDMPMREIAAEITREKLFLHLNQELPYAINVKTDSYKVDPEDGGKITINQTIFVTRESQKGIVLGKKGSLIKQIGIEARRDIAKIAQARIALYLFVKVKEDWIIEIIS